MLQFPTSPIFSKVEAVLVHNNKSTETASGRDQGYSNGPSKLKIETAFNKGSNPDELRSVVAFINRMRGSFTPFLLEVPHISEGTGVLLASPLISQTTPAGFLIKLKGLPPNTIIRREGDLIQHGLSNHVYMLSSDVISDAGGLADANICTPLLASLTANDTVNIDSILIKVKLTKNEHKYSYESLNVRSIAPLTFIQVL
jgi:hypothetical protein